jgi:hypothetical protein
MGPPVQLETRRAPRRRRSAGDVLAGVGAVLLLLILLAGVPVVLVRLLGSPIPHSLPALSLLTHRLDILAILRILSLIVWLAWLQLIVCVIAEVRAAVRNTGMPSRVPLAGGMQPVVHRLVTAALLLFSAATALSPAFAHHAPPGAQQAVTSATAGRSGPASAGASPAATPQPGQDSGQPGPAVSGGPASGQWQAFGPDHHRMRRTEKVYVVQPPEGRYHESLWEIAANHLGDGRRYREIFELNKDRPQPDGTKLTIASLIRPGWILRMPRDAHGPGIKVVTLHEHAAASGTDARVGHGTARGSGSGEAAGTPGPAQAGQAPAGSVQAGPAQAGPAQAGPAQAGPAQAGPAQAGPAPPAAGRQGAAPGRDAVPSAPATAAQAGAPVYPYELAAAALLAAGVLSALGRRRREQLWHRAFGRQLAVPVRPAPAAAAEVALRLGASEPSARMLDTGLRYLSQALASQGRVLPTVFAAHVGSQNLDLWVAPADRDAPTPWVAVGDGQVWRLPLAAVPRLDPDLVTGASAPYPGLVSIGTDATGRVLVDLESAQGLIAVTGEPHLVQASLAAMAVELAANRWSGPITITLVGFGADLTALAPGRVNTVRTLAEALPALVARAELVEDSLAASGAGGVLTGRSPGPRPQSWAPHYVISAVPPTAGEQEQLLALARTRHAAAAGYVIAGDVAGATWMWEVTEQGRLRAGLLGLDVRAQLLPPAQHAAVVDLFRVAEQFEGVALAAPPEDAASAEHLIPGSAVQVEVTLLGRVYVNAPGMIEPERLGLATELVVFLATHPGGVHPNVLAVAIWPRGVTREVRDAMLARVRDWLGADDIGRPHLATDASGRLRLGSQVRVDWQVFRALMARVAQAGPGADDAVREGEAALEQALTLVTGPFMDGREPGRYAWLASDGLEYEAAARVADAAHLLCQWRLDRGDPYGAMDASRAGLRLAFDDELLWRDLLTAAHATGQEHPLRAVVDEVCARTALDDVLPRMAPETEALIDELLPSWRSSVA